MKSGLTRYALMVGALALGGAAVFSASGPVTADDPEPVEVNQPYGILRLQITGSAKTVTFTPAPGVNAAAATQMLTVNSKCGVSTDGSLLMIAQTGGNQGLGIEGTNLGVRSKNNCATDSGRVNVGETLTLSLNSAKFPAEVVVSSAELDIEGKKNADLNYLLDGTTSGQFELDHATSDNGPDSGIGDNDRAIIPGPFRSIRLTPAGAGAEISLNGGGDGTPAQYAAAGLLGPQGTTLGTADSIFMLSTTDQFEAAVDCGDSVVQIGQPGDVATNAVFTRELNTGASNPDECETIPATLEFEEDGVLLKKTTIGLEQGTPQAVNSTLEITWAPMEAQASYPARQIDFDGDPDGGPFEFEDVQWCEGVDPETGPIHSGDSRFDEGPSDGLLPWCLVEESFELQDDGTVVQTQLYDGLGDPMWR